MKTVEYIELRRAVLAAAIKKQQELIDDFRAGIGNVLNEEPVINEDGIDLTQQAKTAEEIITQVDPLGDQLQFANEEMKILYDMLPHQDDPHDRVELGSIIITDKELFFVSVSIERFEVMGEQFFGLSTQAPLYKVMEGKREGDTFTYSGTTYTIQEIF